MRELAHRRLAVLVTGTVSDAHTWNLTFLSLLLREMGHRVVTLGSCVPEDEVVRTCQDQAPDLVVVSSVNGHGYVDGLRLIERLRAADGCRGLPAVIGGKLTTTGELGADRTAALLEAGYAAVFDDRGQRPVLVELHRIVESIAQDAGRPELDR